MKFRVAISRVALMEIEDARDWYQSQQTDLGRSFSEYVEAAIETISKRPFQTQIKYRNVRIFYLRKFPYGIHYEVSDNEIRIFSVFHTSRFPKP